ncbi:MAG: ABC transporter ATP-binding protein [Clostridia bacterium]|nr:ABC transporter ATP-binding protein [Clostridia bacterium]
MKLKTLKRALGYIGKYKYLLPLTVLMAVITVALTLYVPILIGDAIDLIVGKGEVDLSGILGKLSLSALLILITALAQWIMSTVNNRIAYQVVRDMRNDAFCKMERLPLSYIDTKAHGDIVNRVINDTDRFAEGLLLGFTQVFTGVLTILGTLFFMIYIDWKIALVVVLLTPMSILIARFIGSRTYKMFKLRSENEGEATALINEMIGNQKVVLAFGYADRASKRFDNVNSRLQKSTLNAIFFSSLTNPTTRFINNIVYAAVALVGGLTAVLTAGGSIPFTVGQFSCILSYSNQYTKPFNEISGIFAEFQDALASCARVFEILDEKEVPADSEGASEISAVGNVTLTDVSFSYVPEKPLIDGFSIEAKAGERIAIVGPTGCGKTTVINLLMRFYDVCGGTIAIDGRSVKDIKRRSLRRNFGMVLQDTWLMSGTVKDNIAYGRPDATDEEIELAARAAHAHGFITRLKDGYNTVIGEGGDGLSQGQKQLLCIARVMLTLPPMLILDEATSSIDTRTEMRIQRAFNKMMQGRTSFIVAHRLSTIREADKIIVMNAGHIVEIGSHEELLKKGGFYYNLYNSQFAV